MGVFSFMVWQPAQHTKPIMRKKERTQREPVTKKSSAMVQMPTPHVFVIDRMHTLLYFESKMAPEATSTQNWKRQTNQVK